MEGPADPPLTAMPEVRPATWSSGRCPFLWMALLQVLRLRHRRNCSTTRCLTWLWGKILKTNGRKQLHDELLNSVLGKSLEDPHEKTLFLNEKTLWNPVLGQDIEEGHETGLLNPVRWWWWCVVGVCGWEGGGGGVVV